VVAASAAIANANNAAKVCGYEFMFAPFGFKLINGVNRRTRGL